MHWDAMEQLKRKKGGKKKINHKTYLLNKDLSSISTNSCSMEDFSLFSKRRHAGSERMISWARTPQQGNYWTIKTTQASWLSHGLNQNHSQINRTKSSAWNRWTQTHKWGRLGFTAWEFGTGAVTKENYPASSRCREWRWLPLVFLKETEQMGVWLEPVNQRQGLAPSCLQRFCGKQCMWGINRE